MELQKTADWVEIENLGRNVYDYKQVHTNPEIINESPKAIKIFTKEMDKVHQDAIKLYQVWIPKSQVRYDSNKCLWVSTWWLGRNGITKV